MNPCWKNLALLLLLGMTLASSALGQLAGSRAVAEPQSDSQLNLPKLDKKVAESFITVEGRAESRVRPTEVRVVLAVTSEQPTANECQAKVDDQIDALKKSWTAIGIVGSNIVEDFIAVLPVYEWEIATRNNVEVAIEKRSGFRMQTNVHLSMANNESLTKALSIAFEKGITDIIAFDYWSKDLDQQKEKVRELAVKSARSKADKLLGEIFQTPPPAINFQEQTTVHYPESLYQSFVVSYDQSVENLWKRDIPFIRASRPKNTYYRGLHSNADVQPRELPMHPEITIVSTVRIYYESPAAKRPSPTK